MLVEQHPVRHKRQSSDLIGHLIPEIRKSWSIFSVGLLDAVHLGVVPVVMVRHGFHQAIVTLHNLIVTDNHQTHAACASEGRIGCLEVDGNKVIQMTLRKVHRLLLRLLGLIPSPPPFSSWSFLILNLGHFCILCGCKDNFFLLFPKIPYLYLLNSNF